MCLLLRRCNSKNRDIKYITKLRRNTQKNDSRDNTGKVKEKFSEWKTANCSKYAAWQKIWKDIQLAWRAGVMQKWEKWQKQKYMRSTEGYCKWVQAGWGKETKTCLIKAACNNHSNLKRIKRRETNEEVCARMKAKHNPRLLPEPQWEKGWF